MGATLVAGTGVENGLLYVGDFGERLPGLMRDLTGVLGLICEVGDGREDRMTGDMLALV